MSNILGYSIFILSKNIFASWRKHPSHTGFMAGHSDSETAVMYISCSICGDFGPICYICECFRDLDTHNYATSGGMLQKKALLWNFLNLNFFIYNNYISFSYTLLFTHYHELQTLSCCILPTWAVE